MCDFSVQDDLPGLLVAFARNTRIRPAVVNGYGQQAVDALCRKPARFWFAHRSRNRCDVDPSVMWVGSLF
jgi:hypothetical protein